MKSALMSFLMNVRVMFILFGVFMGMTGAMLLTIFRIVGFVLFGTLLIGLPYISFIFGGSLLVSSVWLWGYGMPEAWPFFTVLWKIHLAGAVFSVVFLATIYYLRCYAGGKTFRQYLKQAGWKDVAAVLLCSAIWPFYWLFFHWEAREYHSNSSLGNELVLAGRFWYQSVRGRNAPLKA